MKIKHYYYNYTLLSFLLIACVALNARSQEKGREIEIEARYVEMSHGNGVVEFSGGVVLRHNEVELRCKRMRAIVAENGRIATVEARGDVQIQAREIGAFGGLAIYNIERGEIRLSENPRLESNSSTVKGRIIMLNLRAQKVAIEEARGVFHL